MPRQVSFVRAVKRNKYGAKKTVMFQQVFDSKKEAERWLVLKSAEYLGEVRDLQRQVKFELIPAQVSNGEKLRACSYFADFVYVNSAGETVVEDTKGYRRGAAYDLFMVKKKLMLQVHGLYVREV